MKEIFHQRWAILKTNRVATRRVNVSNAHGRHTLYRPILELMKRPAIAAFLRTILFASAACAGLMEDWALGQSSLSVGRVRSFPGDTVMVPIVVQGASNILAAQFDLAFDIMKVTDRGAIIGRGLTNYFLRSREISPGVRRVVVYSLAGFSMTNRVALATVPFEIAPSEHVSSGPLSPGNVVMAQPDATAVAPLSLNAGAIYVAPVRLNTNGTADYFLPVENGQQYVLEASTDFFNWVSISTNTSFGDYLHLLDDEAADFPQRFYRWRQDR